MAEGMLQGLGPERNAGKDTAQQAVLLSFKCANKAFSVRTRQLLAAGESPRVQLWRYSLRLSQHA
jgi:hypothetical protein